MLLLFIFINYCAETTSYTLLKTFLSLFGDKVIAMPFEINFHMNHTSPFVLKTLWFL